LARKDVQNRGIELEKTLGKNLQAWYLIALNVERSQVQADRTGAMMAATQEQSQTASTPATAAAAPPLVARPTQRNLLDAGAANVSATTAPIVKVKQEPTDAPADDSQMQMDFFD